MTSDLIEALKPQESRATLDRLLRPRSIALIGASATPGSLGESVLLNLEQSGYAGDIYPVNPKRPVIRGLQCLGSIDEVPESVDCAVLAIPGSAVLASIEACAKKRFGSAIVFSAGFAEGGEEGRVAQRELAKIVREHGMILEGPNCLGMVNYVDNIPLTFVVTPPQPAQDVPGAAIVSQSGALAAVIAVNMRRQAIPLTYSISTGNEAASGVEDFTEYLIEDRKTRVFALVVEQFRQPQRFLELARRARLSGKYIVLLHPGSSSRARTSAATHTGAIAGDYDVMRTLVSEAGVIYVESMEELVDVTQILARCKQLPTAGAAVFTESGAFKALALDLCERVELEVPSLSPESERALRDALPAFIPVSNPLDVTAQALVDPDLYRRTLPPFLSDPNVGSLILSIILTDPKTTQLKLPPIAAALRGLKPEKPVVFAALDEGASFDFPELDELRALGIACFPSPERAIRATAHITRSARRAKKARASSLLDIAISLQPGLLSEIESKRVLANLGIQIPRGAVATSIEDALLIARDIRFPVVLKAQSPELPHKSDIGGVRLDIQSAEELSAAWSKLHQDVQSARPGLVLEGVLVERMSKKGLELIVGARNDPQWGPVLMVGAGGVFAEAMKDSRLLAPDLSRGEIVEEMSRLRCSSLFGGFRGSAPLDIEAVASAIEILGRLMRSVPQIAEIDINPFVVYARGQGAVALDALILVAPEPGEPKKDL